MTNTRTASRSFFKVTLVASALLVWACGSSDRSGGFDESPINSEKGGPKDPFSKSVDMPPEPQPCVGLECQQTRCEEIGGIKTSTTIQGVVYDPAGKNPLYNVVVYVPNAPVQSLVTGATCDKCDALYSGAPLVATTTNAKGEFTLPNMPAGDNIPLVIQVGKWRKQMVIPHVDKCMTQTPLADKSIRLPKNHLEGDIPNIAISTGGADSLECLLRRVGIDANEYSGGSNGDNRIHIFRGGIGFLDGSPDTSPGAPHASDGLWNTADELKKYDVVLLSCEGAETANMNRQALFDYTRSGGRVFASHFHYAWLNDGAFGASGLASWKSGTNDMGDIGANIVTSFPKGQALHDWLSNVKALDNGELPIEQAKHNADVSPSHTNSTEWIVSNAKSIPAHATQYFTFNTPIGAPAEQQCGRVVYSDLHVGAASYDYEFDRVVPKDCRSDVDLSAQEKALEFMLFDLSSCVSPDNKPPPEPPGKGPR